MGKTIEGKRAAMKPGHRHDLDCNKRVQGDEGHDFVTSAEVISDAAQEPTKPQMMSAQAINGAGQEPSTALRPRQHRGKQGLE
eukprot:1139105-Pelagomonas_calceolata.AAC.6